MMARVTTAICEISTHVMTPTVLPAATVRLRYGEKFRSLMATMISTKLSTSQPRMKYSRTFWARDSALMSAVFPRCGPRADGAGGGQHVAAGRDRDPVA